MKVGIDRFHRDGFGKDLRFSDPVDLGDALRKRVLEELKDIDLESSKNDSMLVVLPLPTCPSRFFLLSLKGEKLTPRVIEEDLCYEAIGTGSRLAEPFFEFLRGTFWNGDLPTVSAAKVGVAWTLQHTVATSSAGISLPLSIGVQKANNDPIILRREEIQEALETVNRMQDMMRELMQDSQPDLHIDADGPPMY